MTIFLRSVIDVAVNVVQSMLLYTSYACSRVLPKRSYSWVVCPDELAGVLIGVSRALPNNYSVNLSLPSFYSYSYSFALAQGHLSLLRRFLIGPILLGYLMTRSDQFFYIWNRGFLHQRKIEFYFLKKKKKRLAVMFCGDDIRSPKLHSLFCQSQNRDSFVNYDFYVNPPGGSQNYERNQRRTAKIAEKYADAIFNAPNCQTSYLDNQSPKIIEAHGFIAVEENNFCFDSSKFSEKIVKVVHAPSSLAVKGTSYVRIAIEKLKNERDDFEYIELHGVEHETVISTLQNAHICLNQFLSLGTGVLGIEAMAARCATLMSADPALEPSIPRPETNECPWIVTSPTQIYENLTRLLDDRALLQQTAEAGFEYAFHNYSISSAGKRLRDSLESHGFTVS